VRRAFKFLFGALVIVVVGAVAFVAWYIFANRAPAKPRLSVTPPTATGGPATPRGHWRVAPSGQHYVGYRIKELFGDAVLRHEVVGRTNAATGRLTIAGDSVTAAVVNADVTKLVSDREARDSYIHDHALDTDKFPLARFTLTKPIALPAHIAKGAKFHSRASGTLLLRGVTHPVTVTIDARWDGPTIDAVGTAPIVLADFGIEAPQTVIADVDSEGSFEFDLQFVPG
jgi:polyisoprenoid-binding protein YceI